jgi:hypothetical protein
VPVKETFSVSTSLISNFAGGFISTLGVLEVVEEVGRVPEVPGVYVDEVFCVDDTEPPPSPEGFEVVVVLVVVATGASPVPP